MGSETEEERETNNILQLKFFVKINMQDKTKKKFFKQLTTVI